MSVKELMIEIERLPIDERLSLLEALTHNIRETLRSSSSLSVLDNLKGEGEIPSGEDAVSQDGGNYIDEKLS